MVGAGGAAVEACGRVRGPDWSVGSVVRCLKLPRLFRPTCERSNGGTSNETLKKLFRAPPQGRRRNFLEGTPSSESGEASALHLKNDQNRFRPRQTAGAAVLPSTAMDDDDSLFMVGGLRCKSQAAWLVRIGAGQLPKSSQATVKIRVGEDRE